MTFVPEGQRILGCGDRNNLNLRLLEECNQQLAPFVGAGISMKFGYPSWHDLMVRLGRATDSLETVKSLLANNQFEEAAEHISASLPSVFDDVIKDIFSEHEELSRPVSGVLTALATVSNGPVLTTNFDKLLERAFENAGARFEHVYPGSRIKEAQYAIQVRKRCLLKLHGDFEDSESMVLTMTQYVREYGSHDSSQVDLTLPLPGVISQAFQSMPMLFVGCSLKFDRTMQVIGRIAKKYTRLKHFALLSEGERSTQRLHELDVATIRPLFYAERQHERVDDFLACLAEYVEGIDHKQHLAKESATDVLISKVNEGPIYTDNAIATTTDSNPRREKALSKKISGDADERVRINGYKLFYFHKMSGISFLQLSVACGLDKKVLRNLENMNRRVSLLHADPFAKCTRQLLEKLEAVLHCPGQLEGGKFDDFASRYIEFYAVDRKIGSSPQKDGQIELTYPTKAVVFDFDGTLTRRKDDLNIWEKMWTSVGYSVNECATLHSRFMNKEFKHQHWCDLTCQKFREKEFSEEHLKRIAKSISLLKGTRETILELQKRGH